jgi:predicted DNA-binding ArsR family transcriptional regulator
MMSFFNFFGTPKKQVEAEKTSKIVETIHAISDTLKTQEKRKAHLEKQIEALTTEAREFVRLGKKESASVSLKKRKMYENQVKTIDDAMFNLEVQKLNLENTQFQKSAVESFAKVNSVMKETGIKADDVERVMDELQDAVDDQQEVASVLSRPLVHIDVDDELKELEELGQLQKESKPVQVPIILPNVPVDKEKKEKGKEKEKEKDDDEEELEELKRRLEII